MAQIKTFARLKPSRKPYPGYEINKNVLTLHIPDSKDFLMLDPVQAVHSNLSYDILFTNIFQPETTQEEVFDGVANNIIQNFLNGYNGTIFAYGQTGTGKTYTVEGNACKYKTRGLATRALSMIYQQLESRTDEHISVYLSYLEIYQEFAYDLLNPASRTVLPVAPFAKVTVVEGPQGSCILRGLSLHLAANEEIAQMLLLQGQANRKVAETPVNMRSSRSHAVFTVYLQARKHDSDVMVSSKLHLVDLAGSERVSKTGVDGQQLTEAKSINLSLHHLETVIIALQAERAGSAERSRPETNPNASRSNNSFMSGRSSDNLGRGPKHVPYRNSLLTMVLKDSLGGNCLTAMIATISLEAENLGESISTCRFAQRVACVANNARRNEEIDDKTLIRRLKHKVAHLEKQVALLRSKGTTEPLTAEDMVGLLTEEDRVACAEIMDGYLRGVVTDPIAAGICDQCRFRECLHLLRQRFLHSDDAQGKTLALEGAPVSAGSLGPPHPHHDSGDHVTRNSSVPEESEENSQTPLLSVENQTDRPPGPVREGWASSSTPQTSSMSFTLHGGQSSAGGPNATVATNAHTQTEKKLKGKERVEDVEKKVDEISHLLHTIGKDKYRSPFERQREKEIKRLNKKLNLLDQSQQEQEDELQEMKKNSALEELQTAETNLRLKLQVAEDQVADQHAYLLQLRHIQADPDLIDREQLVERHLIKRQTRFQDKLKEVLDSREELDQAIFGKGVGQSDWTNGLGKKTTLEDKFGQYKQAKGSLNTRQVFDMLKNEEKKKKKESDKLEREKVVIKTKHLAMKEEATLEKLRDLKQMLKQSQQGGVSRTVPPPPGFSEGFGQPQEKSPDQSQRQMVNEACQTFKMPNWHVNGNNIDNSVNEYGQCAGNGNVPSVRKTLQSVGKKLSSNPTAFQVQQDMELGSGNFSNGHHPNDQLVFKGAAGGHTHKGEFLVPDSCTDPTQNGKHVSHTVFHTSGQLDGAYLSDTPSNIGEMDPQVVRSVHDPRHSHKFSTTDSNESAAPVPKPQRMVNSNDHNNNCSSKGWKHDTGHGGRDVAGGGQSLSSGRKAGQNYAKYEATPDCYDDDLKVSDLMSDVPVPKADRARKLENHSPSPPPSSQLAQISQREEHFSDSAQQLKPTSIMSLSRFTSSATKTTPSPASLTSTVLPSEYVHSMSSEEKFDARKMGLSSRTFDSALSHMLDSDLLSKIADSTSDAEQYDKYARVSSTSPYRQPQRNRFSNKSSSQARESSQPKKGQSSKVTSDAKSMWGPDIKSVSVADRLQNFLDTTMKPSGDSSPGANEKAAGKMLKPHKRKKSPVKGRDSFSRKLSQYQGDDDYSEDEEDDSFFGSQPAQVPLKALTEEEGQRTYMSRVVAEKERVAKIRKAQDAAQMIQRTWKKFHSRNAK
ncbi:kinesin heavy chain [Aplysia californica]|uniref:Kinesin heavy chain n=1 Tax=Aplysia californica TaxID=6500 RepID=A0ABM0JKS9_APLCA|nr:kinesin heavy chain [Aplysia californica]